MAPETVLERQGDGQNGLSDEKLLVEYQANKDKPAFKKLVSRYERELYNFICICLGNTEDGAEDLFMNVWLKAVREYRPEEGCLFAYMHRMSVSGVSERLGVPVTEVQARVRGKFIKSANSF